MEVTDFRLDHLSATLLLGLTTILLIYWYSTRNHGYWKKRGVVHTKTYPFVGSMYESMIKPFPDVELQRYLKYGKVYGHYEGNSAMISVADPALLRNIFVKDFDTFPSHGGNFTENEVLEAMLPFMHGENWKRIRSIVTPTFTTGKIKKMTTIFKDCSKAMVKNFKVFAEVGKPVEVKRVFGGYTMDVIANSAFSTKIDSYNDPDNDFVKNAKNALSTFTNWKIIAIILFPKLARLFGISLVPSSAMDFFNEVTRQIVEERQNTGQTKNDFLQLLLDTAKDVDEQETLGRLGDTHKTKDIAENYGNNESFGNVLKPNSSKKHLSFAELVAQSLNFFVAGYENIAAVLSYSTYLLALNEDVEQKLIEEVDQTLQNYKGELTYEALQSMKYLDNIISETLRLCPPGLRTDRLCHADYKLGDTGITIPKGMTVTVPIYAIHRDPNIYPDPEKFDPERFNAEERAKRDVFTYLPFGAGPRNCVAMRFALIEVKTCLAYLISNFRIKRCHQTKVPLEFNSTQGVFAPKDVTNDAVEDRL